MKNIYLDLEFRNTTNKDMDLVCVAAHNDHLNKTGVLWLHGEEGAKNLEEFALNSWLWMEEGYRFVAWSEAEARCLIQLWETHGLKYNFKDFRYIDLMLEYRMILNHWDEYMYGPQYIRGKEIVTKCKPHYATEEEENKDHHHKPEYSLAAATYKLLDEKIDVEHKKDMVALILGNETYTDKAKQDILDYCSSDIKDLKRLYTSIIRILMNKVGKSTRDKEKLALEIFRRGEYSARTAKMVRTGYPVDIEKLRRLSEVIPGVLKESAEAVNAEAPGLKPFQWNDKTKKYVKKESVLRQWITDQGYENWPMTDGGKKGEPKLSLSEKAFSKIFKPTSPGLGGKYLGHLRTISSLNGFLPKAKGSSKRTFFDYVGEDGRVRPHFNIYGSQTGRSQPAATGYIPLKSYWLRSFIVPNEGRMCVTIDYGQQEFLIAALLSEDPDMMKAYASGDPYLYFAKMDGAIPQSGTKQSHGDIRDVYKTTVLAILFNMGYKSLRTRLQTELQKPYTEEQAKDLIEGFHEAFPVFTEWAQTYVNDYFKRGSFAKVKLPCGWYLWGGLKRDAWRSLANFPIQGFGSSVMRSAVGFAQDAGLDVIYTLHDALTIECNFQDWESVALLADAMDKGFRHYFPKRQQKHAECRLDCEAWSPSFTDMIIAETDANLLGNKIKLSQLYLDKRGEKEYLKYVELLRK